MSKVTTKLILKCLLVVVCFSSFAAEIGPFTYVQAEDIDWDENSSEIQRINLLGAQDQEGFYVYRVRFPRGITTEPHFHSMERHVTVLEGTWYAGTDASHDISKATPITAGGYMIHPAGAVHFDGSVDGPVVVEIKGIGPVTTTSVEIEL
ncbi:MAG: cupin domain-containing protein [Gammaproteobacteria bacterium]|nr:cupin domain-containing protein [Gammaproteobacteria bacterium]